MKDQAKGYFLFLALMCACSISHAQDTASTSPHNKSIKRMRPEFHYPGRKFFFQGEVKGDFIQWGVRFTGGYRFGQFGILGLGIGVDESGGTLRANNSTDPYEGFYFPLYIYYSGDILKKRVTPFYALEAGYAFRYSYGDNEYITVSPFDHPIYKYYGGMAASIGFGVKLYTSRKIYAAWSLDLDIKQARDKYSNYYINSSGDRIAVSYSSTEFLLMPGFKIDVGF